MSVCDDENGKDPSSTDFIGNPSNYNKGTAHVRHCGRSQEVTKSHPWANISNSMHAISNSVGTAGTSR